jgi:transcription elongation GreA/GreB family factor
MSRAFVKELDGVEPRDELPERAISPHRNLVTAQGLAMIEDEVRRWRRSATEARAGDDRVGLARAERELRYWTQRQSTAEVVPDPVDLTVVRFGSRVTLMQPHGARIEFRIVGEDEADPARGRISYVSPLARSMIGRECGDTVEFKGEDARIDAIA